MSSGTAVFNSPGPPRDGSEESSARYEAALTVWERLRELVQKAALEPYAKEIVYAAPLLLGHLPQKGGRTGPVLAPLFTQSVLATTRGDGSIVLSAQDESLRFNTAVWQDCASAQNIGQIQSLGIDAQGDLAAGWDPERVEELLKGIHAVLPFAEPDTPVGVIEAWPDRGAPAGYKDAPASLSLHEGAALFLSNKSSHYLLHDLEAIHADSSRFLDGLEEQPLSVLLNEPSDEQRPDPDWLTEDQVGFPFPSNPAQRRVADAIEKNDVVVVQGPAGYRQEPDHRQPGRPPRHAGQERASLQPQKQALTVVRDKLNETNLEFLYASLIGDTGQAKRQLQRQITDVQAFAGPPDRDGSGSSSHEIESGRAEPAAHGSPQCATSTSAEPNPNKRRQPGFTRRSRLIHRFPSATPPSLRRTSNRSRRGCGPSTRWPAAPVGVGSG